MNAEVFIDTNILLYTIDEDSASDRPNSEVPKKLAASIRAPFSPVLRGRRAGDEGWKL